MIISLAAVIVVQAYWITSAWENKEEEFSLAVSQSLKSVSTKVRDLEISDYINAYEQLIDSIGTPNESNFTDIFLFVDNALDTITDISWSISFNLVCVHNTKSFINYCSTLKNSNY